MIKKNKIIKLLSSFIILSSIFTSCGSKLDFELFYETIGKDEETIPPGEVKELSATSFSKAVTLKWKNPEDKDFYGLSITASPAEGTLKEPVTYIKDKNTTLPETISITNLTDGTTYSFTIKTFDENFNYSKGEVITAIPLYDKKAPGEVKNLTASAFTQAVTLKWENPEDNNLYGLTISMSPAAGSLDTPLTFIKDKDTKLPQDLAVSNLPGNVSYTFTIKTFDSSMNYSTGTSVTATPDGEDTTTSGDFFGSGEVFSYKKDKSAFDFGYCAPGTTSTKTIEIFATNVLNTEASFITDANRMGQGNFEIIEINPKSAKIGEKITITVKYTPSTTPCWDEMDLLVGGSNSSKLTLIGSSFMQPKNISSIDVENDKKLGLSLWLRADLIGTSDIANNDFVSRLPDYSGRGLHAYNTDSSKRFLPEYVKYEANTFNGLPFVNFDSNDNTRKSQLLSSGSGTSPIVDSAKGSTTFIVLMTPTIGASTTTPQTAISANYGYSYPTLINTYKYYNNVTGYGTLYNGWAVKGSGLYGTYRYPCTSNDLTDDNNTWFTNAHSDKETSVCMWFDQSMSPKGDTNPATGIFDFPANIRIWMNGSEKLLSYIYSNKETTTLYKTDSAQNFGAYGKPVSDGKGHRFSTLGDEQTPSSAQVIAGTAPIYTKWNDSRTKSTSTRKYDWAYYYTPSDYLYNGTTTRKQNGGGYSLASTDDGGSSSTYSYFTNWISQEARRNGTIYSLFIGADNTNASIFRGKIAEVIMYDYALSDEEIKIVNNYIYYRYGIGSPQ